MKTEKTTHKKITFEKISFFDGLSFIFLGGRGANEQKKFS